MASSNRLKVEVTSVKPEIKLAPLEVDTSMGGIEVIPHTKVEAASPGSSYLQHHKSRQTGAHGGSGSSSNHGSSSHANSGSSNANSGSSHGSGQRHRPANLNLGSARHRAGSTSQHSPGSQTAHYLSAAPVPDSTHR